LNWFGVEVRSTSTYGLTGIGEQGCELCVADDWYAPIHSLKVSAADVFIASWVEIDQGIERGVAVCVFFGLFGFERGLRV
jgi:hypothetical protein